MVDFSNSVIQNYRSRSDIINRTERWQNLLTRKGIIMIEKNIDQKRWERAVAYQNSEWAVMIDQRENRIPYIAHA